MSFQFLTLDDEITQGQNVEKKSKIIDVATSHTEPFVSALWVFSYLAYPNSESEQHAFFQAMKFQWQIRNADPKLAKMFIEKKYANILAKGGRKIMHRVSAGRIALFQIFRIEREGQLPTLQNQLQHERILLGWSENATESDSTYKSKVWGASRPVLHIATALAYVAAMNNTASLKNILSHLVAVPLALIGFLELAENFRMGLPSIHSMYSLDQFVKMRVAKPIVTDRHEQEYAFWRPPNLFGSNPKGRFAQMSPC